MNPDHIGYLQDIGLTEPAVERIKHLWNLVSKLNPSELQDLIVTDTVNKEGIREYGHLWFFSDKYVTECDKFMTMTKFDYVSSKFECHIVNFSAVDYDFIQATDASRLTVRVSLREQVTMAFPAVRNNCDYLLRLAKKYFVESDSLSPL